MDCLGRGEMLVVLVGVGEMVPEGVAMGVRVGTMSMVAMVRFKLRR